jgi:hypothetical protein
MKIAAWKLASLASAIAMVGLGTGAARAVTIVDIPSWDGAGTTVPLDAGTYQVSFIGIADGGQFDAWNPSGTVSGCNVSGANCAEGWRISVDLDLGSPSGLFERVDGFEYLQASQAGDSHIYATASAAHAQIGGAALISAPLTWLYDPANYKPTSNPFHFSIPFTQPVNFYIRDDSYGDNEGGISLRLDRLPTSAPSVPEPASWAMMIAGFGLAGGAIRKRGLGSVKAEALVDRA